MTPDVPDDRTRREIAALLRERAVYLSQNRTDRAAEVTRELAARGHHDDTTDDRPVTDPGGGPVDRTPDPGRHTAAPVPTPTGPIGTRRAAGGRRSRGRAPDDADE
ncbi:hypothetical protein B4N89_13490 [Embleya scabrispora]|uniref:Uncharacterized protein n=2 Tax=Embleya scabrispora TaxID=159449 RepID=A0A1T3NYH3_9ACTN|nr:hypothetical protein B4N89_13490 [Embleya scabrispora]